MDINKHIERLTAEGDALFRSALEAIRARKKTSPIILFGAGEGGLQLKELFDREGIAVSFFSDNNSGKWGGAAAGISILPPKEAAAILNAFFVVSNHDAEAVSAELQEIGAKLIERDLYIMFLALRARRAFAQHTEELARVRALLHDPLSIKTFDALLAQMFALDPLLLRSVYDKNQYFFDPHFALRPGETMIDAGAFTGDTVADAVKRFGRRFKAIHCFEPNAQNFAALRRFVKRERLLQKVALHNCGLSDKRDTAYFSGSGPGYHMASSNDTSREAIYQTTIDYAFKNESVNFIKMDIEGAEPLALKGAEKTLKRDTPRLAVCIYHKPEHFWKIPLMLAKMCPDYAFYLRHHSLGRNETVWYAARKRLA